jgi:hypothetical protein
VSLGRHWRFLAKCVLRTVPAILAGAVLLGEVYEVGPGKTYEAIGQAPWAALQPGDTVLIHWRPEPYREKWVICRRGSEDAPIAVRGVPGPDGQLPVISGDQALTSPLLNFWNEARGVIKIGGANTPADLMPGYIVVENLEIRSARPGYKFTGREGVPLPYAMNAAAVYVEKAEHLTIRNCVLRDSGNGLFIGPSGAAATRDVLVEGNYILDNGNQDSLYEHNSYTEALGIVFQFNRYGRLREGARGNNLKDRSAGLVARYNWIEGGNRQLDLVDAGAAPILSSPRYRAAQVYGNILIEPAGEGNRQILHYGGDSGSLENYRKGTLFFHHNTVVSTRTDRTTLFRLSTNEERCEARNNIFYVSAGGGTLSLLDSSGALGLSHNWTKPGWVATFGTLEGVIEDDGTGIAGESPGFLGEEEQDFRLTAESPCPLPEGCATVDAAGALPEAVLPDHAVTGQYVKHQGGEARPDDGKPDIGAFELAPPSVARPSGGAENGKRSGPEGAPAVLPPHLF